MLITIAIDGPVGAGKSSLSDAVASKLNILHLDTGAMYRAIGYAVLKNNISPLDEKAVVDFCKSNQCVIGISFLNNRQLTLLNGQDISAYIRSEEVGQAASTVSRYPSVRQYLVQLQREISKEQSILMDGRDIGTVVLPHAPVKIFLTASAEERAKRRHSQLLQSGQDIAFDTVFHDLVARDLQDMSRSVDPLKPAEDAVQLDTSALGFEESVKAIIDIVEAHYGKQA